MSTWLDQLESDITETFNRISGRSSHVARLRSEFDAGADYNLVECEPGDLDPHAVSSIFKTFLRECEC